MQCQIGAKVIAADVVSKKCLEKGVVGVGVVGGRVCSVVGVASGVGGREEEGRGWEGGGKEEGRMAGGALWEEVWRATLCSCRVGETLLLDWRHPTAHGGE